MNNYHVENIIKLTEEINSIVNSSPPAFGKSVRLNYSKEEVKAIVKSLKLAQSELLAVYSIKPSLHSSLKHFLNCLNAFLDTLA